MVLHAQHTTPNAKEVVEVEMENPLDDTSQLDQTIRQRRERMQQLQAERQSCETGLAQIAAQMKAMVTRQGELQAVLQRNEAQRVQAIKDLDNLLQTRARLQALQQQAQAAAAQSRAAFQARTAAAQASPGASRPVNQAVQAAPAAVASSAMATPSLPQWGAPPTPVTGGAIPPPAPGGSVPPMRAPLIPNAPTALPRPLAGAPAVAAAPATATPPPRPTPRTLVDRAPRMPLAVEVDFNSDTNLFVGFSENVSEGGLFVATLEPLPVGAKIQVLFTLPNDANPIRCDTTVQWSMRDVDATQRTERVPGMGLKFLNLSEADRDRLRAFISVREPLFFPT